jgi:hypothetical protein
VEGHVAEIGGVPSSRRLTAVLVGNFTPPREVRAQFDTVVLDDGTRLPIRTALAAGTAHTSRVAAQRAKQRQPRTGGRGAQDRFEDSSEAAIRAFTAPGKLSRLKSRLLQMLPIQRHAWSVGTLFNGVLRKPLTAPATSHLEARNDPAAEPQELSARLLAPISSSTARRGAPVEAVVTRPMFSPDHVLMIPEGSRVLGEVVQSQPARRFHRNGKLLFVFRQIRLPAGAAQSIQGHLKSVDADHDAHIELDSEGATSASSPKTRFIFSAIAAGVSALSFHQDYNAQGVPDQDIGGRAESGAVGLSLVGTVVAQTSRAMASTIAISGAAFSVYSNFIARGEDVILPANTPVKVSLTARGCGAGGERLGQSECWQTTADPKKWGVGRLSEPRGARARAGRLEPPPHL